MPRFLLPLAGLVLFFAACGGEEASRDVPPAVADGPQDEHAAFLNVRSDVAFVGDEACFSCHEDQYRGFQEHGMAHSFYPLTTENAVETFPGPAVHHPASGYYYRAYREGDAFYQEEYRLGPGGEKTHRLVRRMAFVVGSGTAARTYLTEEGGRYYQLPLTWYTQQQRWDMSPGYAEQNVRFDRLVPERCVACHNSYPEAVPFVEGKYTAMPQGIGCERCHGPGALHVEERLANPEPAGEIDRTIVNPAHLSFERRLDVCQQCHLNTSVSILREGRTAFDFRPGQALASHVALFTSNEPSTDGTIDVISHADRMRQSACFLETRDQGRPMECTTCHDPHEDFRTKGPAYFNAQCQQCHAPASLQAQLPAAARPTHTAAADCASCHMPKAASDAPHSFFTDHWIRVVRDEAAPPAPETRDLVLTPYFPSDRGEAGRLYEGMAYVVYGTQRGHREAMEKGVTLLDAALVRDPEHGEAQYLRGYARLQLGRVAEAVPALEEAVRLGPGIPERLNTLAQAYETLRREPSRTAELYTRALTLQPALAKVRVNYGRHLEAQGRLEEALHEYRRAAEEQPWLPEAQFNLGTAYLRLGRPNEAEEALLQARRLRPDDVETLGNLGMLYASQGRMREAQPLFEQAVAAAPTSPVALSNLGTFYFSSGRADRAIELLTRAVEADPYYLDALVNLAIAHYQRGDAARAGDYARRVLGIDPANPQARQILASL